MTKYTKVSKSVKMGHQSGLKEQLRFQEKEPASGHRLSGMFGVGTARVPMIELAFVVVRCQHGVRTMEAGNMI